MEQLSWRYTVRENVVVFCCKVENVYVAVFLLQSRPGQVQFDSNKQILHLAQPKLLTKVVFKSSSFLMPLLGCTLSLNLNKKNIFFNRKSAYGITKTKVFLKILVLCSIILSKHDC